MRPLLLFLSLCATLHVLAQNAQSNLSTLTIPQIMQGEKFVGSLPENIFWSYDSKFIYFSWNPKQDTLRSLYKVNRDGSTPVKVTAAEEAQLPAQRGDYNQNRTKKIYAKYGDLYLLDTPSGKIQQLTNTVERESNPQFTPDDSSIIFRKGDNLYQRQLKTDLLIQLTDFQNSNQQKKRPNNQQRQWLEDDQLAYFDILEQRKIQRETRERRNEALQPQRPLTIYTDKQQISNLQISPDLRYVTYRLTKRTKNQNTNVPNFVTETGYIEDLRSRSKVGSPQNMYTFHVYDRQRDTTYQIKTEQLEGIYDKPAFYRNYVKSGETFEPKFEQPRAVIMHGPIYPEKGNRGIVVVRSMDNKDRWLTQLIPETGELKLLERQHDDAWIGGPGISGWNFSTGNIGWINDQTIYYQSEETGYSHLYSMDVVTKEKQALTKGEYEIIDVQLSNNKKYFYLTANAEGPEFHHFYRMNATGGGMTQITAASGNHQVTLSPDERFLAVRYSYANQPWELYAQTNSYKAKHVQLTNSTTDEFENYDWRDPEIVRFTARDGAAVPARIYRPDSTKNNGAAIIFVHGAGYLQNVHKWWSTYYREYMFHNFLADNGYTVLDIDYRASNGYGRDWRTAIYQHMGGKDLTDQVDGARFLVNEYGIDKDRIGIYGGSYGGFITLMAMFTEPGVFQSGAALRSVTDWAHYNHAYTSNILNTPVEDSTAYRKSSPIYHAEGLQGDLLMLHGMIDQNVQFQDVVRLSQRLIELGKDNWELAVFPLERHGFIEASSWADEYKRIYKLFDRTLEKKE